ncbi:MAG: 1-acyl-sn-glycerol-3-phosphate acyltransferase [Myxococcales bacterium]|nr:1-acyl-sn-glycerol-3-phosphate acyltransferase [Myxococcales bacterium]
MSRIGHIAKAIWQNSQVYAVTCGYAVAASASLAVSPTGRVYLATARRWAKDLCAITGLELSYKETYPIEWDKPFILMSNHSSLLDIPVIYSLIPADLRFLAKKEIAYVPFLGWSMVLARFIFIDRGDHEKARRSIDSAAEAVRGGRSIVIFPEGTRSPDGNLRSFKKGGFVLAIKTGVPVVPAFVSGTHRAMPKDTSVVESGPVSLTVGRPIDASRYTLDQKQVLMDDVRAEILRLQSLGS